jgi:hypothetical protein
VFGAMGGWVPFATLFVLVVGANDPAGYIAAYGGLTAIGAALGLAVNLVFPQLPLTPAALAQEQLREQLADQLTLLADGLDRADPLTPEEWEELRLALDPQARRVEELVEAASESRRANWRATRWAETADRGEEQARALQRLTGCVDEVIALVGDVRTSVHGDDELGCRLRNRTSAALRAVASMLGSVEGDAGHADEPDAPASASARAREAVAHLAQEAARAAATGGERCLGAAAIAVSLQQAVEAWS